ncbi:MAG: lipid A deacylase LpxR family protein [Alphaproteobacteria bacterium]|nr:DUF2219 family protein [Alphaproteobacteria bacterium]MDE2111071.1 lipid A deacylase LpxR family protein [Alphaproteobacteria bacterium]MDE2494771.1 lipid A deacylase LpxR family protein [Alphaproteobacteria bacterium]
MAAQAPHAASEPATFTVLFENDIFFNTDRDYTNGVQFTYTTGPNQTLDWAVDTARRLPFFAPAGKVRTGYALGQNIYTPKDTDLADPPLTERPYAGFLYGAIGLMEQNPDKTRLDQLQLQFGVIGPASLAEDAQKWVHSIIHNAKPRGWPTQLRDEPGLALIYEAVSNWFRRSRYLDSISTWSRISAVPSAMSMTTSMPVRWRGWVSICPTILDPCG